MSFLGQLNFGYPITTQNIIATIPDNAVLPFSIGSSLQGNILGVTFGDLKSQVSSPSVIAVNGTSLYSTTPVAGPTSPNYAIALGELAGENTPNAAYSNFLGYGAGTNAASASHSNFLGQYSGLNAINAAESNFLGYNAGRDAVNAIHSNFLGNSSGSGATNANFSNFLGQFAGQNAAKAGYSNFFGSLAGFLATKANNSNFFGGGAGNQATNANNSNFLGTNAGNGASNANRSNFLGPEAGMNSTGNNVNAFGYQAHKGGSLSGQTVFSNATLPSYANRAAATTAITVPNGAVAGNTYLYYNQTTFAIEGVRL